MIQLIVGQEGKGKTTKLLEKVNEEIKSAKGNFVFLDKNKKYMYELNNKVRLIDVSEFNFSSYDSFYGFLCGIISQDHDLEKIFIDNFLRITSLDTLDLALNQLSALCEKYNIDFVLSIAKNESDIPDSFKSNIIVSL